MIDCEKCGELISCMIDGELPAGEEAEVRAHIASCSECRSAYEAFSAMSAGLSEPVELPEGLHESIMAGIASARKKKKRRPWIAFASAAACLALIIIASSSLGLMSGSGGDAADEVAEYEASESFDSASTAEDSRVKTETKTTSDPAALLALLAPAEPADGEPEGDAAYDAEPTYTVGLGDTGETAYIYIDGDEVYADLGEGVYKTAASPQEIEALLGRNS